LAALTCAALLTVVMSPWAGAQPAPGEPGRANLDQMGGRPSGSDGAQTPTQPAPPQSTPNYDQSGARSQGQGAPREAKGHAGSSSAPAGNEDTPNYRQSGNPQKGQ
jgi:hypothetical protein